MMDNVKIGEFIQEEIDERGWTVEDLAEKSLIRSYRLREVIAGSSPLTRTVAMGLSTAFGTSMEFWMNLKEATKR